MSQDSKNLPNAEALARALSHLVILIEEASEQDLVRHLPLRLAKEALIAWEGKLEGVIEPGIYEFGTCPTCKRTTVLKVS